MPEPINRPTLWQRLSDSLEEIASLVDDAEYKAWIVQQPCYLCSFKTPPRGQSEDHHTETGKGNRRSYLWRIPSCRHHHMLVQGEPYLEELLNLKKVARHYLNLFLFERWFKQRQQPQPGVSMSA